MKKFYLLLLAATMLAACNKPEPQEADGTVTITFQPYQVEPMKGERATTALADNVNHLDVWICQGGDTIAVHQTTSDADFGTVSVMLDRTKTYTLHAVGHKANGAAVISDEIIRFPEEKVTHSMYASATFSPANTTSLSCSMNRIVGMFKLIVQDEIPDNVDHFRFAITTETGTRWSTADNEAVHYMVRESIPSSMNPNSQGYVIFNTYIMADNLVDLKYVNITAQGVAANGSVVKERQFDNVPVKDGWVATYQGQFFTDSWLIITFDVDGWEEFEPVNING